LLDDPVKCRSACHSGEPFGTAQDKLRDMAIFAVETIHEWSLPTLAETAFRRGGFAMTVY
jgi:hypothetical protein